jgi:hypothetical protein
MPPTYPFPTPLPVVPGGYLVRAYGANTLTNTPVTNQFAWRSLSPATLPSAGAVAAAFAPLWGGFVNSILSSAYHSTEIGVYDLSTSSSVEIFSPAIYTGGQISAVAPPNITARLAFPTAVRRKHGGTHIGPIVESFLTASKDQLTGAAQGNIEAAAVTMIGQMSLNSVWPGSVATHCIMSTITNKLYLGQFIPVDRIVTPTNLGSQRRRRGY